MRYLSAALVFLHLFFVTLPDVSAASEKGILLTEDMALRVADAFMDEREFYRAITEYKRFLVLFPDSDRGDYAIYKIGMAHYFGEEYEASVKNFERLMEKYPESRLVPEAMYTAGLGSWKLKQYDDAETALKTVEKTYPDSAHAPLSLIAHALLELDRNHLDVSVQDMNKLLTAYPGHPAENKVQETIHLFEQYQDLPQKSEVLAGAMSAVIPGSGYLYAEHYGDGVTAFLINALAITGTISAVNSENYAVAAIVGGIGLPFYFGNIYGSANAAKKWNLAVRNELRNKIAVTLDYDF